MRAPPLHAARVGHAVIVFTLPTEMSPKRKREASEASPRGTSPWKHSEPPPRPHGEARNSTRPVAASHTLPSSYVLSIRTSTQRAGPTPSAPPTSPLLLPPLPLLLDSRMSSSVSKDHVMK
ncbi:hypothetical protein EYF80_041976 [Liparis tanakae]|uniref:Uncharacterized protein n=1 Tax=Liparis tanakae TaxID=230148 RepID=A0A4Z2G4M0_9TELE|nr:hypothetical protein EYF80_041976 [Liparis tanakae]